MADGLKRSVQVKTAAGDFPLDEFTEQHLQKWLDSAYGRERPQQRQEMEGLIKQFVSEHPDVLDRSSWPEIRSLIERNKEMGIVPMKSISGRE
jgi:hypothetical protein